VALGVALAAGCADAPKAPVAPELFAVIPGDGGHVGSIVVQREGEKHVIDTAYGASRVRSDGGTETTRLTEAQVREAFGSTLAALPGKPATFLLYFLEGKDELTPDSQRVIQQIFAEIGRRPAPEIAVIGHTDRVGSVQFNDALSLRRAQKIRDDLVKLGVVAEQIQVAGRGEREPLVATEDEVAEPQNRRVEISVR